MTILALTPIQIINARIAHSRQLDILTCQEVNIVVSGNLGSLGQNIAASID
ncbi:Uncharacterised protein [Yersinia rohdei]|nr:Uncharacterised protein [Yersinia rohdei]